MADEKPLLDYAVGTSLAPLEASRRRTLRILASNPEPVSATAAWTVAQAAADEEKE